MLCQKILPTFDAVQPGQTAVCDLDLNRRYHVIVLEMGDSGAQLGGGSIAANIPKIVSQIRVKVNDKVQRTMTGTELNQINGYHGSSYSALSVGTDGASPNPYRIYLPIFFANPWRTNGADVEMTALNAVGIDQFSVEVDLLSTLTTPVVTGFYDYDACTSTTIGGIEKWIRSSTGTAGQTFDFASLVSKKDYIYGVHLWPTSDGKYVQQLQVQANGTYIRDLLNNTEIAALQEFRSKVTDSSGTPRMDVEFDYDLEVDNALNANGLTNFTWHVVLNAASTGTMVTTVKRFGPPE